MSQIPASHGEYGSTVPKKTGLAIAALVCAIVGFCVPLAGLVGIVLGAIALAKTSRDPQTNGGKGMALAGVIVGVVALLLNLVMITAVLLPSLGKAREAARDIKSSVQLRQIGMGLHQYAMDNKDWMPETSDGWEGRLVPRYVGDAGVFVSPHTPQAAGSSYVYLPPSRLSDLPDPSSVIVAYERPEASPSDRVPVLFADGRVEMLSEAELEAALAAQRGR